MQKTADKYIVDFVVIYTIVAYFQLFRFVFIPNPVRLLSQIAACGLIVLFLLFRIIYFDGKRAEMNFKGPLLLMLLGTIPSFLIGYSYHNQNFTFAVYSNRLLFFYLFYFFLHLYQVQPKFVIKIILAVGIIAVLLYYVQFAIHPTLLMDIRADASRGTIRIFVPGLLCTMAAYFYFLNKFFENNNFKMLLISLLCFSVFILQGTRQLIFALFFITLLNLILSHKIKSRFLMLFIISLASISVFLTFREIFLEIFKVSSSQSQNFYTDVRVKAATFFLTRFMPAKIAYLFGNSAADGVNPYSIKMAFYAAKYGYFLSDIGIIGDYVKYGVIFVLGALTLLYKAFTIKVADEFKFLKYYILAQCFTLFTGDGIFAGADIVIISSLYVLDINKIRASH